MTKKKNISVIRFDWAMKKMLRDKANFAILEGFLSELLRENITIKHILESESNQEEENDKHNRVDIFVENEKGELIIIEVQNSQEYDYFHRILFGTSKAIVEHIMRGQPYAKVKKIISITIAYFELGQGEDYLYQGTTNFIGVHKKDKLDFGKKQKELYEMDTPADIYPEYWLIKVENFKDRIKDPIDEWIYLFKNSAVRDDFKAKGISEAKERMQEILLGQNERKAYLRYLNSLHDLASEEYNKNIAFQEELEKQIKVKLEKQAKEKEAEFEKQAKEKEAEFEKQAKEKEAELRKEADIEKERVISEMILNMEKQGLNIGQIATITGKTEKDVTDILVKYKK
jgi:predicted transposase/invertase (TIGR01784 family)